MCELPKPTGLAHKPLTAKTSEPKKLKLLRLGISGKKSNFVQLRFSGSPAPYFPGNNSKM